jgi:NADPH-dependent glutamate synthase beta subunit-like oxidoreductase
MGNQLSENSQVLPRNDPPLEKCQSHGIKKHFCVIGGGASGIIVMKELTALGHKVTCFERLPRIGKIVRISDAVISE